MYESLKMHTMDFHLYIFAFDDPAFDILNKINPEKTTVIPLHEFEDQDLLEIKNTRTKAEYCWTCTPSTVKYVIEKYNVPQCTYIDADLIFYSDPAVLIEELLMSGKNVLITEHRFSAIPKLYEEKRGGRFCVQFVTFTNEKSSLMVLEKWRLQCIDWCYARYEDGKFGDQKYLDDWPVRYDNIHILQHPGGGIAPWNSSQYIFTATDNSINGVIRKTRKSFRVIFYHFQYVKLLENSMVDTGWYPIPQKIKRLFYFPYLEKISKIEKMLVLNFPGYKTGYTRTAPRNFKDVIKYLFKKLSYYNIIRFPDAR
jgi:hypothetical protein